MQTRWKIIFSVLVILLAATSTITVLLIRNVRELQLENASLRGEPPPPAEVSTQPPPKTPEQALYYAIGHGQRRPLKTILDASPELINATGGRHNATPLHVAANNGRAWIVEELIRRHANVNATNSLGFTPLHDAITSGNPDTVSALLKNKADLTIKNLAGQTPLQYALARNRAQLADLLREAGAKE